MVDEPATRLHKELAIYIKAVKNLEAILNMLRNAEIEMMIDAGSARDLEYYGNDL